MYRALERAAEAFFINLMTSYDAKSPLRCNEMPPNLSTCYQTYGHAIRPGGLCRRSYIYHNLGAHS